MCAYYLIAAGIIGAVLAAIPGFIDYLSVVPPSSSAKKRAAKHGILNVVVLLLFATAMLLRHNEFTWVVLLIEAMAVVLLTMAGWLGGTLVYRNQIGVDHRYAQAGKWKEVFVRDASFPLEVTAAAELKTDQMILLHVNGNE